MSESSSRTFKVTEFGGSAVDDGGRYHGKSPLQAAKKAFGQHCRRSGKKTCKRTPFTVTEVTQNSKHKSYNYVGERRKLKDPQTIERGGTSYKVEYENVVKKA